MPDLFDMDQRVLRRDRAARVGVALFIYERAFEDCLERIGLMGRHFERALLLSCPDPGWPERLRRYAETVEVHDPGSSFAFRARGEPVVEDSWIPAECGFDLVLALGTLDTVNSLPLALRLILHALGAGGLFIGALSGGDTLPQLRAAMRAADAIGGAAAPHVHPRIEASALAPLLTEAGFANPVVDVDRVGVSYRSLEQLIGDLRAMGTTNILTGRPHWISRAARAAAMRAFSAAGDGSRTRETFEILHFAAWAPAGV